MAKVTAALIKQLRDKTGAGMMKCKKALENNDGDVAAAEDWLRKQGVKSSVSERQTSEGAIAVKISDDGKKVAMSELLCETDFAARNENFQALQEKILNAGLGSDASNKEELSAQPLEETTVEQVISIAINTIGENVRLNRFTQRALSAEGYIGHYVHTNQKVGVIIGLKTSKGDSEAVKTLAKQLSMHVAGAPIPPLSLSRDGIDKELIAKEEETIREIMNNDPKDSKKPENIKDKIIGGKMNRFYKERVLGEQAFVMDDKQSINDVVKAAAKEAGDSIEIEWFDRWAIG